MNRPMLIVVGVLVLVGAAIFLTRGPSSIDRIEGATSCGHLEGIYRNMNEAEQNAVRREYQARFVELEC